MSEDADDFISRFYDENGEFYAARAAHGSHVHAVRGEILSLVNDIEGYLSMALGMALDVNWSEGGGEDLRRSILPRLGLAAKIDIIGEIAGRRDLGDEVHPILTALRWANEERNAIAHSFVTPSAVQVPQSDESDQLQKWVAYSLRENKKGTEVLRFDVDHYAAVLANVHRLRILSFVLIPLMMRVEGEDTGDGFRRVLELNPELTEIYDDFKTGQLKKSTIEMRVSANDHASRTRLTVESVDDEPMKVAVEIPTGDGNIRIRVDPRSASALRECLDEAGIRQNDVLEHSASSDLSDVFTVFLANNGIAQLAAVLQAWIHRNDGKAAELYQDGTVQRIEGFSAREIESLLSAGEVRCEE